MGENHEAHFAWHNCRFGFAHRRAIGRRFRGRHADQGSAARGGSSFAGSMQQPLGFCSHGLSVDLVRHHGLRHD
jgi:hypothetical protein